MGKPHEGWDSGQEREIRQTLGELRAMDEAGYFAGLDEEPRLAEDSAVQTFVNALLQKSEPFSRKVAQLKPLDYPVGPALSQFMSQLAVRDRTETYKQDAHKRFEEAVGQVRILFRKISRGEVASNAVVRSIVGSLMDTFMKDRNLLVNLATAPCAGDDHLFDHSLKQCLLALSIASAAGYARSQAIEIAQGALLADIGMMLVPERIRMKRGKLSEGEQFEMRKHPALGLGLLEKIHGLSEAVLIISYQHHERVSGSGYPERRSGSMVSRFSRIASIADVFTALVNRRSYRESVAPYQAMVSLLSMGGEGHLDGDYIKHFLRTVSIFPLGSLVRLAGGEIAKVVHPNPAIFTKPVVSVLTDGYGTTLPRQAIRQIDLSASEEKIAEALPGRSIPHHILDGF